MDDTLTLQASDLLQPAEAIEIPQAEPVELPSQFVQRAVSPLIQANTQEAQQRDQVFEQIQEVGQDRPSFQRQFEGQLDSLGTPDAVNQLRDVQTELNRLNTDFGVQNVQIAEGNSIGQAQREVSQNERERAVRTAGLAAQAQLLQGNIQTAQSIARDTVNFAFQEEQNRLNQLQAQYNALDGRVQGQEAQLLAERQRLLEQEQAELDRTRDQVALAIQSGASPDEVAQLTSPNLSNEDKVTLAQEVQARRERERIEQETALTQSTLATQAANRANIYNQINERNNRIATEQAETEQERREAEKKFEFRRNEQAIKGERVIKKVLEAKTQVNPLSAGLAGQATQNIGGTPAKDLANTVETVKAILGFEELQRMREASPTGGALGQVAVQELIALQATVASLDTTQSPEQLSQNLDQVMVRYISWVNTLGFTVAPDGTVVEIIDE